MKGKDWGKSIKNQAEDLMAEALEHEIDHFDGKLYIDHVESANRLQKVKRLFTPERGTIKAGR